MENESFDAMAPIVGAIAGGIGCAFLAERLSIRREAIAVGAGVAGLLVASHTNGLANRVAVGVAAAGASMLAVEILRRLKPDWNLFAPPQRQAAPNDVITREDLDEALARAATATRSESPPIETTEPADEHLGRVATRLTADEREKLAELRRTAPAPIVVEVERRLRSLSVEDAVRFLRLNVLPHARVDHHAQR